MSAPIIISEGVTVNADGVASDKIHQNFKSDVIIISEDKLRNILMSKTDLDSAGSLWHAPVGMTLSLVAALLTADFKSFIGVPGTVWRVFFIVALFFSVLWIIKSLLDGRKRVGLDALVNIIKNKEGQEGRVFNS